MVTRIALVLLLAGLTWQNFAGEPRTLVVNSTALFDETPDVLTLPEAVQDLNDNGPDGSTILFNIGGTGPHLISLSSPLTINRPMTISGATQPGYAGTPVIQIFYNSSIDSFAAGTTSVTGRVTLKPFTDSSVEINLFEETPAAARAAQVTGNGVTLRALSITGPYTGSQELNFDSACVTFVNGGGHAVEACYIGLTPAGAVSGSSNGIYIQSDVDGIRVGNGGSVTNGANTIGGNSHAGIYVRGRNVLIAGNRIGVLPSGAAVGNERYGVRCEAQFETADYDLFDNTISNNGEAGAFLQGCTNVVLQGNRVTGNGMDVAFTEDTGTGSGLVIAGGSNILVGTNGDNTNDAAEGNLVSGNGLFGIYVESQRIRRALEAGSRADPLTAINGVRISGNTIGLDSSGAAQPNGVYTATDPEEGTYTRAGIYVGDEVRITIGTDKDSSAGDANEGNVISANIGDGIFIEGGNFQQPGVAARALPEGYQRIIAGNKIGTAANGTTARGNSGSGVRVDNESSVLVGGTLAGAGNLIANNGNDGVSVTGDSGVATVTILGNSITANTDRGIDLNNDGLTLNDANSPEPQVMGDPDSGPNGLSNFPVLTALSDDRLTVSGTLNSDIFGSEGGGTVYRVEIYSNPASSPDQGQRFLGAADVTISNSSTFTAAFAITLNVPATPGSTLSATATRLDSFSPDTSEFYAPIGARLSVPALAFSSNPTFTPATPLVGDTVTFSANATLQGITVSWDYGDGSTGTGATTTHVYGAPGTYTVSVTLLDPSSGISVSSTLQVPVTAPAAPPATPSPTPFRVRDLIITLRSASNSDTITVNGLLNLPRDFKPAGQVFEFDIEGIQQSFTLNKSGRARVGANTLKFARFLKKGKRAQDSSFTLNLKKGAFSAPLKEGALNPDSQGLPGTIVVRLRFNGTDYNQVMPVKFKTLGNTTSAKFGRF